mgnify:CR=1 FL=1
MLKKITIAIDGHSSTGKSTLAKELAKALGYIYVDSGAMYRCVTLFAMQNQFFSPQLNKQKLIDSLPNIDITFLYDADKNSNKAVLNGQIVEDAIRTMDVSNHVSEVAAIPEVRKKLVEIQQKLGRNKGVVMDGRDIGTVVFPNAELKIFMTASAKVRAQRRFEEMQAKGEAVSFQAVFDNLQSRDEDDSTREDSPLLKAADAVVLDNSELSRTEQFDTALSWAKLAIEN